MDFELTRLIENNIRVALDVFGRWYQLYTVQQFFLVADGQYDKRQHLQHAAAVSVLGRVAHNEKAHRARLDGNSQKGVDSQPVV